MFAIAEVDLRSVPGERLEAEMTTLAAHLHSGMCRFLLMVAEFDRRELFESWECRGTAQWLTWKCAIAARTAREHVHVARALAKLPTATAAFARGELSYAKVRAMARVIDVVPEDELMNLATSATAGQLERILGTFARHHRAQDDPPAARAGLQTWWDDEGMFHFSGSLSAEDAAVVLSAMATIAERRRSGSAEPPSPGDERDGFDVEVFDRRRAEDLVGMA